MAKYLVVIGKADKIVRRGGFMKLASLKVNSSTEEVKEIAEWPADVDLEYAKWSGGKVVKLTASERTQKDNDKEAADKSAEWARVKGLLVDNKTEAKTALGL
jgi:hypothetical protein